MSSMDDFIRGKAKSKARTEAFFRRLKGEEERLQQVKKEGGRK